MKRLLLTGLMGAGLVAGALGQPAPLYNNPVVQVPPQPFPPQIDATAWVINNPFNVSNEVTVETIGGGSVVQVPDPYETADTVSYTNNNQLGSNVGFVFDDFAIDNDGNGTEIMSSNFVNNGVVFAGVFTNVVVAYNGHFTNNFFDILSIVAPSPSLTISSFVVPSQITVWATNVVSPGLLEVGQAGDLNIHGGSVDMSRGIARVEPLTDFSQGIYALNPLFSFLLVTNLVSTGFPAGSAFDQGIFSEFWPSAFIFGADLVEASNFTLPNPISPTDFTTDVPSGSGEFPVTVQSFNANAYANDGTIDFTNEIRQVVFINNPDPNTTVDVRYEPVQFFGNAVIFDQAPVPTIRWRTVVTNVAGALVTNTIYFQDNMALQGDEIGTFLPPLLDQFGQYGVNPIATQPSFRPDNFNFSTSPGFFTNATFTNFDSLPPPNQASYSPSFLLLPAVAEDTIFGVNMSPATSEIYTRLPGTTFSNMPGRIEITADQVLNLKKAKIDGANYLALTATNHFAGSPGAQISAVNCDINLASTNGTLSISNLLAPSLPAFSGQVACWSGQWTAINLVTSNLVIFQVTIISNGLSSTTPVNVQNLTLSAGTNATNNLYISDVLNVSSNAQIITPSLTITTNPPGSLTAAGAVNLASPIVVWSGVFPVLQYVTNFGTITTLNSTEFATSKQPPFYPTTGTTPYQAFVNHGTISVSDGLIWANYVENTGVGAVTNGATVTTNLATIGAVNGNLTVQAGTARMTNGSLSAPGQFQAITLGANNLVISNHNVNAGAALTLQVTNSINAPANGGSAVSTNYWQAGNGFNLLAPKPATGDLLATTVTNLTDGVSGDVLNTWAGSDLGPVPAGYTNNVAIGHLILDANQPGGVFSYVGATGANAIYVDLLEFRDYATNRDQNDDFPALDLDPSIKIYFAGAQFPGGLDVTLKVNGHNNGQLQWVTNYNVGLFSSTNVSFPDGKVFSFNRARVADPFLPPVVEPPDPGPVMLSVQLVSSPAKGVLLSWSTPANAANTLFYKTNISGGGTWQVLTNFTMGGTAGKVSVLDQRRPGGAVYRAMVNIPQ